MFAGFTKDTFQFFKELEKNNNRNWFLENKSRYEDVVLAPALELVSDIQKPLSKISPCFSAIPKRSGGSLMRIYRDTRFSKNKTPYKTNLGINFRHIHGKDVHAPGFYFHVANGEIFFGAGIWRPETPVIKQIRSMIDEDSTRWKRIVNGKKFTSQFHRQGEKLKRPPQGFASDHELIEDLKYKDHFATIELQEADLCSEKLIPDLCRYMKGLKPYLTFLCDALQLPS